MLKWLAKLLILYKVHILCWFIYIFYEVVIVGLISGAKVSVSTYVVHYMFNIVLFYTHAHFVLPRVFKKPRQVLLIMPPVIVAEIIIYFCVLYSVDFVLFTYLGLMPEIDITLNKMFLVRVVYRCLYFIGFSTGYYYLITFIKERILNEKLEKQQLNAIIEQQKVTNELNVAVNAYLKAQINPHFLFNTLNYIYNSIRKTSPQAAEAIITLSDMMRYAIKSGNPEGLVLLSDEVEQLRNLITLHQIRQEQNLHLVLRYSGEKHSFNFIPLVLLTLAENIFKHGNLSKANRPALFIISVDENNLQISTSNLINEIKDNSDSHLGLENIKQRLHHAYGNRAVMNYYADEDNFFHVELSVEGNYPNPVVL